jgi:hypothetical protein
MGASHRGGKGFPRPAVLASRVRLCRFRHPLGAMVCALLRGLRHGHRVCCGTRHSGVIRGGGLVVWPVIALVTLAMRHTKDLWEGRRHRLAQMQAVGDLRGLWSPWPTACGRGFGAVPGDQLDVGMGLEPRGHGCSRSSCKHVQGAPPLASDEKGAVALAVAPCPVVDAKACRCRPPGQRHPTHTPKQGRATPWGAMARQGASSGSAAEHRPRVGVRRGQSRRRARLYSGATLGSRWAQVWRRHVPGQPRKRRTLTRSARGAVAHGKSARVRRECPWLRSLCWRPAGQVEWAAIIAASRMS